MCFVRMREGDRVVLTTYGRSSGYCVDPVEKKPLNHFLPGTPILSFGTAGCNLACKFCQNWDMSKSREMDTLADAASPETIAKAAKELGCKSVAFTYNDPTIFLEYAMDVADACHDLGINAVAVTAGYICEQPRRDLYAHMDAANVDLKAFTEPFYEKVTASHLQPVLETLQYLKHETGVWLELTTLMIPGLNDSERRDRRDDRVGRRKARPGRADALHGVPPRLQDAGDPADAAGDARHGASHRAPQRSPLRLYGQRSRRGRGKHVLPRLRREARRT